MWDIESDHIPCAVFRKDEAAGTEHQKNAAFSVLRDQFPTFSFIQTSSVLFELQSNLFWRTFLHTSPEVTRAAYHREQVHKQEKEVKPLG